ncbi:MAG: hypothetical protein RMY34_23260 [Aulosira sp. DedQUE10]|nr:hypothetical protein [Aulosira sp. DedQUE10]
MKPIGFYANNQNPLIADMEESWGSRFENLNEASKAWMIYQLGYQLWFNDAEGQVTDEAEEAIARAQIELKPQEKLRLLEALINQLK